MVHQIITSVVIDSGNSLALDSRFGISIFLLALHTLTIVKHLQSSSWQHADQSQLQNLSRDPMDRPGSCWQSKDLV